MGTHTSGQRLPDQGWTAMFYNKSRRGPWGRISRSIVGSNISQEVDAGATSSKEEVSWIALCNVR